MENWVRTSSGWCHRPWWKVVINSALRCIQPWSRRWVIFSRCVDRAEPLPPRCVGYGFGRVLHLEHWWLPQAVVLLILALQIVRCVR